MPTPIVNALSVDVEDYFQVSAFEQHVLRAEWGSYASRVVGNTQRLLEMFERQQVKATFFVLGWTAKAYPDLIRQIDAAGHELGSHSYWHRLVYDLTPDEFRTDLIDSRSAIEDAVGHRVTAYRAPSFSITQRSVWALEVLAENGFTTDSSVFPIYHDRYGMPQAETRIHQIMTASGPIREFPPAVVGLGRFNMPVSGGGYFRLYPLAMTTKALSRINRHQQRPFVFYVHPWEIDPDQPRIVGPRRGARMRHYVNLTSTYQKLELLLSRFRFGTVGEVLATQQTQTQPQIQFCELAG